MVVSWCLLRCRPDTAVDGVAVPCPATSEGVQAASGYDRNDSGDGLDRSSGRLQCVCEQALGGIYRFVRGGHGRWLDGRSSPEDRQATLEKWAASFAAGEPL